MSEYPKILTTERVKNDIKDIIEIILSDKKYLKYEKRDIDIILGPVPTDIDECVSYLRTLVKILLFSEKSIREEKACLSRILKRMKEIE